jgi:transposase-like protein
MNPRDEAKEAPLPPKNCPSCRSRDVTTSAKVVDTNTYWRCVACGEVWNLARRQTDHARGFPTYGGFRR